MDYSLHDPLVLDATTRLAQAEKILRVLNRFTRAPLTEMRCLDVGCSSGIITRALAQRFAYVVGVDVDWSALTSPTSPLTAQPPLPSPDRYDWESGEGARFTEASALALPFDADSFDVAVCNQVYQYVPDVPRLFAELQRVLRRGGCCYFSARNLWGIAARENRTPFVASLFPSAIRDQAWRHRAGTLWPVQRLRALAQRHFIVHDYTTRVLREPALSDLFVPARYRVCFARAPRLLLAAVTPILPTHIWVLQKP